MDDGGSDVITWDEISARENGTDGFFGDLSDDVTEIDDEYESTGDLMEDDYYDSLDADMEVWELYHEY